MITDDSDEESAVVRREKRVAKSKLFQQTSSKSKGKTSGKCVYMYTCASLHILGVCAVCFCVIVMEMGNVRTILMCINNSVLFSRRGW